MYPIADSCSLAFPKIHVFINLCEVPVHYVAAHRIKMFHKMHFLKAFDLTWIASIKYRFSKWITLAFRLFWKWRHLYRILFIDSTDWYIFTCIPVVTKWKFPSHHQPPICFSSFQFLNTINLPISSIQQNTAHTSYHYQLFSKRPCLIENDNFLWGIVPDALEQVELISFCSFPIMKAMICLKIS